MDEFLNGLGDNIGMFAIGGTVVACFIMMSIVQVVQTRAKERTRREVAAYVAEGSMTTDEAERILCAGGDAAAKPCCSGKKRRSSAPAAIEA